MFYLIAISGDPSGELISRHETIEQAHQALFEAIEADAEDVMRYGIPKFSGAYSPTYAEALEYVRDFFYIVEVKR